MKPTWFQRHLNWTYVIGIAAGYAFAFILGFAMGYSDPDVNDDAAGLVGQLGFIAVIFAVGGWVLVAKGRSLWWVLLAGWGSPLWLGNRRTEAMPTTPLT